MKKKRLDTSPFLRKDESVITKGEIQGGKGIYIEMVICFALWVITLAGDCFGIGVMHSLKDLFKDKPIGSYMALFISSTVIHMVPFAFWLISIFRRMAKGGNSWYALTESRVVVVCETQPQTLTIINFRDVTSYQILKNGICFFMGEERYAIKNISNLQDFTENIIKIIDVSEEEGDYDDFPDERDDYENNKNLEASEDEENFLSYAEDYENDDEELSEEDEEEN